METPSRPKFGREVVQSQQQPNANAQDDKTIRRLHHQQQPGRPHATGNLAELSQDQKARTAAHERGTTAQIKAQQMASALEQITTSHVRDVLDFSKTKGGKDAPKTRFSLKDKPHTPAQLRVMRKKREAKEVNAMITRDRPRHHEEIRKQSAAARLRYLTDSMLPMSTNQYIKF